MAEGILMLFLYSMGLGIPFILSAVLIEASDGGFRLDQIALWHHHKSIRNSADYRGAYDDVGNDGPLFINLDILGGIYETTTKLIGILVILIALLAGAFVLTRT